MLGTDSPYDMGETDPVGLVDLVAGLSKAERELILKGSALKLLNMA